MRKKVKVNACPHITTGGPENYWGGMYLCDDCLKFITTG